MITFFYPLLCFSTYALARPTKPIPSRVTIVGSDTAVVPNITLHIVEETGIESKDLLIITLQHHENVNETVIRMVSKKRKSTFVVR